MQRLLAFMFSIAMTLGGYAARATGDQKAAELLAQARAALGGERTLSKVEGLSCAGTAERAIGDRQMSGDVTIDLQLPDKYVRSDSISPMKNAALAISSVVVGPDGRARFSMRRCATPLLTP